MSGNTKKETLENPQRRLFGKGFVAVLASPLVGEANAFGDSFNAFDRLKDFSFLTQDGREIKGDALKSLTENRPFTVSYGFGDCVNYCPFGNSVFAVLGKASGDRMKHIVINVNPEGDPAGNALSKEFRERYSKYIAFNKNGNIHWRKYE